jgi:peptidoglycan/LPS O-acetylase OafA/YrhL
MLLAVVVRAGKVPRLPVPVAVLLAVAAFAAVDVIHDGRWQVVVTLVPFALLIVAAARSDLRQAPSLLRHPWLVRAGQWSYAFYLVHWPVLLLVAHFHRSRFSGGGEALVAVVIVFAVCVVLSGLLFTLWERPWEIRLRPEHRPPAALRSPGSAVPNTPTEG